MLVCLVYDGINTDTDPMVAKGFVWTNTHQLELKNMNSAMEQTITMTGQTFPHNTHYWKLL